MILTNVLLVPFGIVFNVLKRDEVSKCWLAAEGFIVAVGGRAPIDKL